ncbi:MAG: nuclear transport factor 2 family protein [Bacteroidota bacterium]
MKSKILLLIAVFTFQWCLGQSDKELVQQTLQNYMDGSSYNNKEQLSSAFADNATLYLTVRGEFKMLTAQEYVSWFKGTPGEFNGRVAKLLSIELDNDIATAKAEILIPRIKARFIDLFLLKKEAGHWKIISKTASRQESDKHGDRVLFVLSNAHFYGDTDLNNGNSFYEIVKAYVAFNEGGYNVDFVSPEGGAVPIAYINTSDDTSKTYLYDEDLMYALKYTMSPSEVDPSAYKAIQFIGGGASMFGVPENKAIQQIAMDIYEKHKGIVSSVCHGTSGIVYLKTSNGKYLVDGKRVSGYPDAYENKERPFYATFPFKITQTIEKHGGIFKHGPRNTAYVEVDGRLVTGQNWLSSVPVAEKIIELLQEDKL